MKLAHVFVEHPIMHLDHTFTYRCDSFDVKKGVRVKVPFGKTCLIGFVSRVEEVCDDTGLGYDIKDILEVIDKEALINEELFQLADWMAKTYIAPRISCFQSMLPAKLKPSSHHGHIKMESWVRYVQDVDQLTKKQQMALNAIKEAKEMPRSMFYQLYKTPGKKLIERKAVEVFEKEAVSDYQDLCIQPSQFILSEEQQNALLKIQESEHHEVILLHGATGSGKTEVFLRLASSILEKRKQVLFLVPEISLTPLMVQRVKQRFGAHVAIYHSGLNEQEKYEQYQLVKQHKVSIVVGTRSAVFMPFDHLGLIILDEEHDDSYKQDVTPRYHCRDVAIQRGKYHDAKVILASATPSLESYARAIRKVYRLIEMPQRVNGSFPDVQLVKMRQAIAKKESYIVSNALLDAIYDRLEKKEQVILLLNRRGYTPILRCISCGYVQMCPHCEVAMSYHKEEHILKCHTCGHTMALPDHCPACGASMWRYLGMGTQKLEEFIQLKFPQARILRMDADTTSKKNAHESLLEAFGNQQADILLGTQMIAKGLDFANVTLVGIINGDALLNRSDYRSAEMTYDLLEQACGRSGRGDKKGEVIIQAYDCEHYALTCAVHHDYRAFFVNEMKYRHLANYPPYTYLVSMIFAHKQESEVVRSVKEAMQILEGKDCRVLGPAQLIKKRDEIRSRILLKGKDQQQLNTYAREVYQHHLKTKQKARLDIDMDAHNME